MTTRWRHNKHEGGVGVQQPAPVNRGGRGHRSECPSYCKDDTARELADQEQKLDGSARLLEAMVLYYQKLASQWGVSLEMAMRIVDGMQRASLESYAPRAKAA